MSTRLNVAQHRRRFGASTAAVVLTGVVGMTAIALAKDGKIDPHPWGYLGLAVGVFAALSGLALAYAMAAIESRGDWTHREIAATGVGQADFRGARDDYGKLH